MHLRLIHQIFEIKLRQITRNYSWKRGVCRTNEKKVTVEYKVERASSAEKEGYLV